MCSSASYSTFIIFFSYRTENKGRPIKTKRSETKEVLSPLLHFQTPEQSVSGNVNII